MIHLRPLIMLVLAMSVQGISQAQDATILADGKAFVESIAPKSPGQIVDPTGVNAATWPAAQTTFPTAAPSQLGAFSTPVTSSTLFQTSKAQGALAALGNARIQACRGHVSTGNVVEDQECAAVVFMDRNCMQANVSQQKIMGAAGGVIASGVNCADTYGAGQSNFGYQDAIAADDPIFNLVHSAQDTASSITTQTCVPKVVVTDPEKSEINNCNKTLITDPKDCSQDLDVVVVTKSTPVSVSYTCPTGTLNGKTCSTSTSTPAAATQQCPANAGTLTNGSCVLSSTTSPTTTQTCVQGSLSNDQCIIQVVEQPTKTLTCPSGQTLNGNTCESSSAANKGLVVNCSGAGASQSGDYCNVYAGSYPLSGFNCWPGSYGKANGYYCAIPMYKYSCDTGTLNGTQCITTSAPTETITCSSGLTLDSGQCKGTTYGEPVLGYSCPTGWTLNGAECTKSASSVPTTVYSCPNGGQLSGTQCVTSSSSPATSTNYCPTGTISGNVCITRSVLTKWIDNCTVYENSAGIKLGTP